MRFRKKKKQFWGLLSGLFQGHFQVGLLKADGGAFELLLPLPFKTKNVNPGRRQGALLYDKFNPFSVRLGELGVDHFTRALQGSFLD